MLRSLTGSFEELLQPLNDQTYGLGPGSAGLWCDADCALRSVIADLDRRVGYGISKNHIANKLR